MRRRRSSRLDVSGSNLRTDTARGHGERTRRADTADTHAAARCERCKRGPRGGGRLRAGHLLAHVSRAWETVRSKKSCLNDPPCCRGSALRHVCRTRRSQKASSEMSVADCGRRAERS